MCRLVCQGKPTAADRIIVRLLKHHLAVHAYPCARESLLPKLGKLVFRAAVATGQTLDLGCGYPPPRVPCVLGASTRDRG